MDFHRFATGLKTALQNPLPGLEAHKLMMPSSRGNTINYYTSEKLRDAAVLICLFPENNRTHTIFIERTQDAGPHSGQIAFPGGKYETTDASLIETATREASEEIGIVTEKLEIIGHLSAIKIPVSGFSVLPVIALLNEKPHIIPSADEVKSVLICDILDVLSNKSTGDIEVRGHRIHAPYYRTENQIIWGATAMLLSELEMILQNRFF